ncbi:uncharacterized protein LOC122051883 isoform X1 [Zingiber officinale]|uniref:uncharacterized protein LOC122051883 isoform X1 n=2 Tax=Zingiber officinale TaxID=94328 RepID=UPI001C4B09F7|nr:uncharacterized protein LOC122051883 isoform X1 [Zingiber officinale]XP_042469133.1 uncharacterized protein LOC122051883 isoform X1 [Zingiber officinale]
MNIFRRGGRKRSSHGHVAPSSAPTPIPDQPVRLSNSPSPVQPGPSHLSTPVQAGPSHSPSRVHAGPSHSPSPIHAGPSHSPSPVPSPQNLADPVPTRYSFSETQDVRIFIVPSGDSFENSVRVVHEINQIVNNHWMGDSMSYSSTPSSMKELWWSEFKRIYNWDPAYEFEIKKNFKKKCGDHIRHTLSHAKQRGKKPLCITEDNWTKINNFWSTNESKQRSQQNKLNQSYNSGDFSATYAGGSINIDEHRRRMTKDMGKEPSFIETFTKTFTKKDKSWSGARAKAIKDKYDELEIAHRSSCASEETESSVGNNLDLWLEASGGQKGGRILGMGSLSKNHRVSRKSFSTPTAVTTQINSLTEEVSHLKGIILERDEERRVRDAEMRALRQQQNLIMKHLQLSSAPSDFGDDGDDGGDGSS